MMKVAFITGALGQDGVLISELLKNKGYKVVGFIRENKGKAGKTQHSKL